MNEIQSNLAGTKTEKNLYNAFTGESKAHTKYKIFAAVANEEDLNIVGDVFTTISGQEKEHAELWLSYLGEIGDTLENLENCDAGEAYEAKTMYPEYAKIAEQEGFKEIADKFSQVGQIEASHMKEYQQYIQMIKDNSLFNGKPDTIWICTNCGHRHIGGSAPEYCPVCSYPQGYFTRKCE